MLTEGLVASLCACALFLGDPPPPEGAGQERDRQVAVTLAVQTALEQGRGLVLRGEYRTAVHVLEGQLTHINGNRAYLRTLQDAYRGYVKELRLANQDAAAETYLQRLRILDPGAVMDAALRGPPPAAGRAEQVATVEVPKQPIKVPTAPQPPAVDAAGVKPTVRMQAAEEPRPTRPQDQARELLARAEHEFSRRRYVEAGNLYEQAHQADRNVAAAGRSRWAYCKLHGVVEQINQPGKQPPQWTELEREARAALDLAPQLDFGKQVLAEISKRKAGPATRPDAWQNLPVRHVPRQPNGWCLAESANFRVFHNQPQELAAQVARVAEQTRAEMQLKWFGGTQRDWTPRCDIILYATADDYHRATGLPTASPGHSKLEMEGNRLIGRQVHLRRDHANVVTAILPHEVTHVVLAGGFTEAAIPRWADEGVAVLTEPREQVERHLRDLPKYYQQGQLFGLRELMEQTYQPQQEKYPEARRIGAFYAQSISLVEFLSSQNGPPAFMAFLRDGLRSGYEPALQRHFGISNYAELQRRWLQHAFGTAAASPARPAP